MSELRNRMIQDMKLAGLKLFYLNTLTLRVAPAV